MDDSLIPPLSCLCSKCIVGVSSLAWLEDLKQDKLVSSVKGTKSHQNPTEHLVSSLYKKQFYWGLCFPLVPATKKVLNSPNFSWFDGLTLTESRNIQGFEPEITFLFLFSLLLHHQV